VKALVTSFIPRANSEDGWESRFECSVGVAFVSFVRTTPRPKGQRETYIY